MQIEIWSDVVCPWCYIGKRRFEAALERFPHRDQVNVIWRSFELDPAAPREASGSYSERLASKYRVPAAQAEQMIARMTEAAAGEGLEFHFERAQPGNTFDAHRLIHLATEHGRQEAMEERLMRGYFTEGQPIGEREALIALGTEVGLDPEEVRTALESDAFADAVRADEERAARFGISGVPFFAIDEAYGISGAQPGDVMLDTLNKIWQESHPLVMVGGASCEGDNCGLPQ